jgi:DNA-binding MarR family transcriptional regulator
MYIMADMRGANERPAFERGVGFLLARLGSLAGRSWQAFLIDRALTQVQYAALTILAERGPLGQQRLAQLVAVDARNLVAVLDHLDQRGLVTRQQDQLDHRRRTIRLTERGTALVRSMGRDAAAANDRFLAGLTAGQREELTALLQRLYEANVAPD